MCWMQSPEVWGAGNWLMSMLGVVILSFGFKIFGQKDLMVRHAPEIFSATTLSAVGSMYSTAILARLLGLAPGAACVTCMCCMALSLRRWWIPLLRLQVWSWASLN